MRKSLIYGVPFALATLLAVEAGTTKAAIFFDDVESIRATNPTGDSFNEQLAAEYRKLTVFEADEMYDWLDAESHAAKGMAALDGQTPLPYDPADWGIDDPAKRGELELARVELMTLLDSGARSKAPHEAAVAQAQYDCWVEQQEEGHQFDHIAACRDRFFVAMDNLNAAMAEPKPEPTAAVTTTIGEIARDVVYFEFDQSTITPAAQTKIDSFVAEMKGIDDVTLFIEGHADKSGPSDYNQALSAQRASAVRAELQRQGMSVGDYEELEIVAEGESDPAVATEDGVRHPLNRRVEIVAQGVVTKVIPTDQTASVTK